MLLWLLLWSDTFERMEQKKDTELEKCFCLVAALFDKPLLWRGFLTPRHATILKQPHRGQGRAVCFWVSPQTIWRGFLISAIPAEDYHTNLWINLCSSRRDRQLLQSTSTESWIIHFLFTAGDRCVTSVMSAQGCLRGAVTREGEEGGKEGSLWGTML